MSTSRCGHATNAARDGRHVTIRAGAGIGSVAGVSPRMKDGERGLCRGVWPRVSYCCNLSMENVVTWDRWGG